MHTDPKGNSMTATTFVPTLFVGIGETSAFYTLRETSLEYVRGQPVVTSYHLRNLSQDVDTALLKASQAAQELGLPLSNRSTREALEREMREVERRTAADIERDRGAAAESTRLQAEAALVRRGEAALWMMEERKFCFGRFHGFSFDDAPRGYLTWLANQEDLEPFSLVAVAQAIIRTFYSHKLLPRPHPSMTVGAVGKRQMFENALCTSLRWFDSEYGRTYISTFVLPCSACVVVMSSSFKAQEGDVVTFKATVKEFKDYKGQMQTLVQRVAVVHSAQESLHA